MATAEPRSFVRRGGRHLIGMIHVGALPGTARSGAQIAEVAAAAAREAEIYAECGLDAIMIENMHDRPYLNGSVGAEITAAMTRVALEVKRGCPLPCGIQILAGANREALAVAAAAELDFVRVEGFVFAHIADEGIIDSSAGDLLRYRRQIGAESVQVLADIKKKHSSHSITADTDIAETARAAEFFLADGVIITGAATGEETSMKDLERVRAAIDLPVCVGSGVSAENVAGYLDRCDAVIVGSACKEGGDWRNPVCRERVARLADSAASRS